MAYKRTEPYISMITWCPVRDEIGQEWRENGKWTSNHIHKHIQASNKQEGYVVCSSRYSMTGYGKRNLLRKTKLSVSHPYEEYMCQYRVIRIPISYKMKGSPFNICSWSPATLSSWLETELKILWRSNKGKKQTQVPMAPSRQLVKQLDKWLLCQETKRLSPLEAKGECI